MMDFWGRCLRNRIIREKHLVHAYRHVFFLIIIIIQKFQKIFFFQWHLIYLLLFDSGLLENSFCHVDMGANYENKLMKNNI